MSLNKVGECCILVTKGQCLWIEHAIDIGNDLLLSSVLPWGFVFLEIPPGLWQIFAVIPVFRNFFMSVNACSGWQLGTTDSIMLNFKKASLKFLFRYQTKYSDSKGLKISSFQFQ